MTTTTSTTNSTTTVDDVLDYVDTCLRGYKEAGLSPMLAHMYCVKEMLLKCGVQSATPSMLTLDESNSGTQPAPRAEKKMLGPGTTL